jgi:hypothetical protein
MGQLRINATYKLLVAALAVVVVFGGAIRLRGPANAQGIVPMQELPLTTAYFYGPLSVSENHMVKMCSNNLFGDGSVRANAALINSADGRVLVARQLLLARRAGECVEFRPTESVDILGVLWAAGGSWGDFNWNSARASAPVASLQAVDVTTSHVIAIINSPGKVTVDTALLPDMRR